ncbi:hypothetical protein Vadar_005513 [Vaccinium darrowii]|uniref:Uncharacterized protein n=1 Tax=Vaccinium darrowii TaxID=229202 RepID=A0ACB7XFI8_9ERIC|nr:hypothetical protein Vadar_005513 [Vaccinium darrowii]
MDSTVPPLSAIPKPRCYTVTESNLGSVNPNSGGSPKSGGGIPLRIIDILEQVTIIKESQSIPRVTPPALGSELRESNTVLQMPMAAKSDDRAVAEGIPSWRTVLIGNSPGQGRMKLEYIPPLIFDNMVVVSPWRTIAMRIWGKLDLQEVLSNDHGFFLFLFFQEDALNKIQDSGPWFFWWQNAGVLGQVPSAKTNSVALGPIPSPKSGSSSFGVGVIGAIGLVSSAKPSSLDSCPSSDHSQDVGARSEVRSGKKTVVHEDFLGIQLCDVQTINNILSQYGSAVGTGNQDVVASSSVSHYGSQLSYDVDFGDTGFVPSIIPVEAISDAGVHEASSPDVTNSLVASQSVMVAGGCSEPRPQVFLAAWQYAHNLGASAIIRVLVGWNPLSLSVSVVFVSQQMVMLSVELLAQHKTIFVSVVYGHNLASDWLGL